MEDALVNSECYLCSSSDDYYYNLFSTGHAEVRISPLYENCDVWRDV